jgi:hypothetical protein
MTNVTQHLVSVRHAGDEMLTVHVHGSPKNPRRPVVNGATQLSIKPLSDPRVSHLMTLVNRFRFIFLNVGVSPKEMKLDGRLTSFEFSVSRTLDTRTHVDELNLQNSPRPNRVGTKEILPKTFDRSHLMTYS